MGKHLNPLEKELLIRRFKGNPRIKVYDFCVANDISEAAFRKWMKQYEAAGLEGLARQDAEFKDLLPEGSDLTLEGYASTFPHCSMKSSEYLWPKTKRLVKDERRSKSKLRVCA